MRKQSYILFFSLVISTSLYCFPSLEKQQQRFYKLAKTREKILNLIKHIPSYKKLLTFREQASPLLVRVIVLGKKKLPILLLLNDNTRCLVYKNNKITLLRGSTFYMEGLDRDGRLFRRLETKYGKWLSFYHDSGKLIKQPQEKFRGKPLCAEQVNTNDNFSFLFSKLKGEFQIIINFKHYQIRYSRNGIISFNDAATKLLFYNYSYQTKKANKLLAIVKNYFPYNIFSKLITVCQEKKIALNNRTALLPTILNHLREKTGLPPVKHNSKLQKTAQAHAQFLAATLHTGFNINPHNQIKGGFKYSGDTISSRAKKRGYKKRCLELIGFKANPISDILAWTHSAYHCLPILTPIANESGYGKASINGNHKNSIGVLLLGTLPRALKKAVFLPMTQRVHPIWNGLEKPSALKSPHKMYGPPLTIMLPFTKKAQIKFLLSQQDGTQIAHVTLHHKIKGVHCTTIIPHLPLRYNMRYCILAQKLSKQKSTQYKISFRTTQKPAFFTLLKALRGYR